MGVYAVYIVTNRPRGVLYTGVTGRLAQRAWQHREGAVPGFTRTYNLKRLVWFEPHEDMIEAITREKRIKRWRRAWKFELIERDNPQWRDLGPGLGPDM